MSVRVSVQYLAERGVVQGRPVVARPFERAATFDLNDLQIRNRGLELRVPVDQPLVLIDEALAIKLDEHLGHGPRQTLIEGKSLPAPVARSAEALQLLNDRPARLGLPRPDALEKGLPAHRLPVGRL